MDTNGYTVPIPKHIILQFFSVCVVVSANLCSKHPSPVQIGYPTVFSLIKNLKHDLAKS